MYVMTMLHAQVFESEATAPVWLQSEYGFSLIHLVFFPMYVSFILTIRSYLTKQSHSIREICKYTTRQFRYIVQIFFFYFHFVYFMYHI